MFIQGVPVKAVIHRRYVLFPHHTPVLAVVLAAPIPLRIKQCALLVISALPDRIRIRALIKQQAGVVFTVAGRHQVFRGNFAEIQVDGGKQRLHVLGRGDGRAVEGDFHIHAACFIVDLGREFRRGAFLAGWLAGLVAGVFFQQLGQFHAEPRLLLFLARGEGGGHGRGLDFTLVTPRFEIGQMHGLIQQGEAVFEVGLRLGQPPREGFPTGRQALAQLAFQPFHVAVQAWQFARDAGGQTQGFQAVQLCQGAYGIGKTGDGRGEIGAEAAEAGLRPEQGHRRLGQLEVIRHHGKTGDHAG